LLERRHARRPNTLSDLAPDPPVGAVTRVGALGLPGAQNWVGYVVTPDHGAGLLAAGGPGWIVGMQMVQRPWGVVAYGAASVRAMPDLVRVRFKVVRVEQTPSQSFAQASESVHAVRDVLRQHGIPDRAVERSRLGLKSAWSSFGPDRKFLGYECQAAFAVE
jgi:hypothetical protein